MCFGRGKPRCDEKGTSSTGEGEHGPKKSVQKHPKKKNRPRRGNGLLFPKTRQEKKKGSPCRRGNPWFPGKKIRAHPGKKFKKPKGHAPQAIRGDYRRETKKKLIITVFGNTIPRDGSRGKKSHLLTRKQPSITRASNIGACKRPNKKESRTNCVFVRNKKNKQKKRAGPPSSPGRN